MRQEGHKDTGKSKVQLHASKLISIFNVTLNFGKHNLGTHQLLSDDN